jgi:hypothetical protein
MWYTLLIAMIAAFGYYKLNRNNGVKGPEKSIFEFKADRVDDGESVSLSEFKGKKAYLVVNVASECGLTERNYAELQDIYDKYRLATHSCSVYNYFFLIAV